MNFFPPPFLRAIVTVCAVALLFFVVPRVFADDAVVGDGSPASCTESAFASVLETVQSSGGGTITFNCGSGFRVIPFSTHRSISTKVTIDGNTAIAFDGGGDSAFFRVGSDGDLTLRAVRLQNGADNGVHPLENRGILLLDTVTLRGNVSYGSVLYNQGTLTLRSTEVSGNQGVGLQNDAGTVSIEQSAFISNTVGGANGSGSAVANLNGTLAITKSYFISNEASARGGAIYASGSSTTTVEHALFTQNRGGDGGAMAVASDNATVAISDSTFLENSATVGSGGALAVLTGTLTVDTSQFTSNSATLTGGATGCMYGALTVTRSSFVRNEAGTNGGGIYTTCTLHLLNSTLSNNHAVAGGGIFEATSATATVGYATIVENRAEYGAGVYAEGGDGSHLLIGAAIVAYNTIGNCDGVLLSEGYNFTNDTGCTAFIQPSDQQGVNLPLSPIGNYGGSTLSRVPLPGNPAIDAIPLNAPPGIAPMGISTDQRGVPRPQGAGLDSGAVERAPQDDPTPTPTPTPTVAPPTPTTSPTALHRLYLPLIQN